MIFEVSDVAQAEFWGDAMATYESSILQAQREWAGRALRAYPDREKLTNIASALRKNLDSMSVEVNSIADSTQLTVARVPEQTNVEIPMKDSLCVFTVAIDKPLKVTDIPEDAWLKDHNVQYAGYMSWASVPIRVAGFPAGTVCALEGTRTRDWTEDEEEKLQVASDSVSKLVSDWVQAADRRLI